MRPVIVLFDIAHAFEPGTTIGMCLAWFALGWVISSARKPRVVYQPVGPIVLTAADHKWRPRSTP